VNNKVFFPQYAKTGLVEILANYSVGNKNYKVYLITIDDMNKFVYDEREKGKLQFITLENATQVSKDINNQINQLSKQISELKKEKEQCQYITSAQVGKDIDNQINQLNKKINELKKEKEQEQDQYIVSIQIGKDIDNHINQLNKQINKLKREKEQNQYIVSVLQNNKPNDTKPETKESFVIKTPFGYIAGVGEEGVAFAVYKNNAQIFDTKEEAIKFGKNIFQNQLPFMIEIVDISKKECHQPAEKDSVLNIQFFSDSHFENSNIEEIKKMFPNAEIKTIDIDKNGNIHEL